MTTTFAFARDLDDEPQPVTLDDAYAAIRGVVEENKRLRAEVKELRAGPAGTFAEAIDLIRDHARDSEGVIDTVLRLIGGQSEPAPTLTPERAAILDDAVRQVDAELTAAAEERAQLLAAIQTAIPAISAGINALGSSKADVRQRNAARDSLHALEAAAEGQAAPAAVLSAAELEAVRGVLDAAAAINAAGDDADLLHEAHGYWAQAWAAYEAAGRPLASEGAA